MFRRRAPRAEGQPRFGDRRKTKRQPAGWEGRYRVVDQGREHLHYAGDDYLPCLLTDLSMQGAGLHVTHDDSTIAVGDHIELDLPLGARRGASIQVRATVRHIASSSPSPSSARAGLEFVAIGDLERALLLRLLRDLKAPATQLV